MDTMNGPVYRVYYNRLFPSAREIAYEMAETCVEGNDAPRGGKDGNYIEITQFKSEYAEAFASYAGQKKADKEKEQKAEAEKEGKFTEYTRRYDEWLQNPDAAKLAAEFAAILPKKGNVQARRLMQGNFVRHAIGRKGESLPWNMYKIFHA
jgi:hypothetical protein